VVRLWCELVWVKDVTCGPPTPPYRSLSSDFFLLTGPVIENRIWVFDWRAITLNDLQVKSSLVLNLEQLQRIVAYACGCCHTHSGCSGVVVQHRTRNREVAGSTHIRSTASNFEQFLTYCTLNPTQPSTLSGTGNE